MSAAPTHPARPPPPGRCHQPLSGAFIVPPVPHASRSFVLAATRLRALRLDPLVTGSQLPSAEQTPKKRGFVLLPPAPVFIERLAKITTTAGTVDQTVFSARHAGLWSGGMGTVSDDIGPCESTQA